MDCGNPESLRKIQQGQRVCLLYDEDEDPLATVAPAIAAGLEAGERCVYICGRYDCDAILSSLAAIGVDAAAHQARDALLVLNVSPASCTGEKFEPETLAEVLGKSVASTRADGFTGLRLVSDMDWVLHDDISADALLRYKSLVNTLDDPHLTTFSLYDRSRFSPNACLDAIRVHPWVVIDGAVYSNLYYEPPDTTIEDGTAAVRVDWMLAQLKRVHHAETHRLELLRARAGRLEAEAAARARDELLSILGHELRTPLTSMLAYAQATLRKLNRGQEVDPDAMRHTLEVVTRQADKQRHLLSQILDAARVASGHLPLEPEHCDVRALIQEIVELTRATVPEREIAVRCVGSAVTDADPLRLEQVLGNLLDNAVKYSPSGSPIEVTVAGSQDLITVGVRDRGPGIPLEQRSRIFESYQRAHPDRDGTGLGLYISREIIRMHGGDIQVEAPDDGGTRFVLRLPRRAVHAAESTGRVAASGR